MRLPRTPVDAETVVAELADVDRVVDVIKVIHESGVRDAPLDPHDPAVLAAIVDAAHARAQTDPSAADLLLVEGNPLEDLRALRHVAAVLREGRLVVDARG